MSNETLPADADLIPAPIPADDELTLVPDASGIVTNAPVRAPSGPPAFVSGAVADPIVPGFTAADVSREAELADRDAKLRVFFEAAAETNEDDEAAVLAIGSQFGLKYDEVRKNLPEFRRTAKLAGYDPAVWAQKNPLTLKLLLKNPHMAQGVLSSKELGPLVEKYNEALAWVEDKLDVLSPEDMAQDARITAAMAEDPDAAAKMIEAQPAEEKARWGATREKRTAPILQPEQDTPEARALREDPSIAADLIVGWKRGKQKFEEFQIVKLQRKLMIAEVLEELSPEERKALGKYGQIDYSSSDIRKEIHDRNLDNAPLALGDDKGLKRDFTEAIDAAASSASVLGGSFEGLAGGAAVGAAVAGTGAAIVTKGNPSAIASAAVAGGRVLAPFGMKAGAFVASFDLEQTSAYKTAREMKTDSGEKLTPMEAMGLSILEGIANASLETVSFGAQAKVFKHALPTSITNVVKRDPTFRALVKNIAKDLLHSIATEGTTEGMQNAVNQAGDYFGKSAKQGDWQAGPIVSPGEVVRDVQAGGMGALFMGLLGGATTVTINRLTQGRAEVAGKQVKPLLELAQHPLVNASPGEFSAMVREASGEGGHAPVDKLFVDSEALTVALRRLNQKDETGQAADAALTEALGPDGPRQLREAVASGGKVAIDLQTVFSSWGKSDLGQALVDDTTTDADALTPRQLKEQKAQLEKQAKEIADGVGQQMANDEKAASIQDQVEQESLDAGFTREESRDAGILWQHFYSTLGRELRQTPEQVMADFRVRMFKGDNKPMNAAGLTAEVQARALEESGPGALPGVGEDRIAALQERFRKGGKDGAPLEQETRVRDLFIDPVSGLRNSRGWQAEPRAAGKQVAAITSADFKAINDHPTGGHDATNDLLRLIGAEVAKVDPEAAREGTTFLLHVADQEQLDKALEAIRAKLPEGLTIDGGLADEKLVGQPNKDGVARTVEMSAKDVMEAGIDKQRTPEQRGTTKFDTKKLVPGFRFSDESAAFKGNISDAMVETVIGTDSVPGKYQSEADFIKAAWLDPTMPGALNRTGFEAAGPREHVLAIDGRKLKALNEKLGKAAGNAFLAAIGRVAQQLGGEGLFFAHLSGDEFAAKSDSKAVLESFASDLQAALVDATMEATDEKTGEQFIITPSIRYGLGEKTYAAADQNLNERKRQEAPVVGAGSFRPASEGNLAEVAGGSVLDARRRRADARRGDQTALGDRQEGGVGAAEASDFDPEALSPGSTRPPSKSTHTPAEMADARAAVARMQTRNRTRYTRFLDFVEGWSTGAERPVAALTPYEERQLAREFGIVDPEMGFAVNQGVDAPSYYKGATTKTEEQPVELAKHRPGFGDTGMLEKMLDGRRRGQTSDIRAGEEALAGVEPGKVTTVRQLATALEQHYREKYGNGKSIPLDDHSDEVAEKLSGWMAEEALFELAPERIEESGLGWYTKKYQRALNILQRHIPSLKSKSNRNHFTLLVAITSNGEEAQLNFANAVEIYKAWDKSKDKRLDGSVINVARGAALQKNLVMVQGLVDKFGLDGAHEFLMKEDTVGNLKKDAAAEGVKFDPGYPLETKLPMSAVLIGPKLGAFYANLMGAGGYLTMDMWQSRGFNRMRGDLTVKPSDEQLARLRRLLGDEKMKDEELLANVISFHSELEERDWIPDIGPAVRDAEGKVVKLPSLDRAKVAAIFANEADSGPADRSKHYGKAVAAWKKTGEKAKAKYDPKGQATPGRPPAAFVDMILAKEKGKEEVPGLSRAKQAINKKYLVDGGPDPEVVARSLNYANAREMLLRAEIERVANGIHGAMFTDLRDAPSGKEERRFMIRVTEMARQKIEKAGHKVTIADVQAILWFYEKRLYKQFRVRGPAIASYEDAARAYVDRAEGRDGGDRPSRPDAQGAGGRSVVGPAGVRVEGPRAPRRRNQSDAPTVNTVAAVLDDEVRGRIGAARTALTEKLSEALSHVDTKRPHQSLAFIGNLHDNGVRGKITDIEFNRWSGIDRMSGEGWSTPPNWRGTTTEYLIDQVRRDDPAAARELDKALKALQDDLQLEAWSRYSGMHAERAATAWANGDPHAALREARIAAAHEVGIREKLAGKPPRPTASLARMAEEYVEPGTEVVINVDGEAMNTITPTEEASLREAPAWGPLLKDIEDRMTGVAPGPSRIKFQQDEPVKPKWYSAAEKAAGAAKQEKNTGSAWWSVISKSPGVKAEELEFLGLKGWLDEQKGSVAKQQVVEFIKAHQIEVREKSLQGGFVDGPMGEGGGLANDIDNAIRPAMDLVPEDSEFGSADDLHDRLQQAATFAMEGDIEGSGDALVDVVNDYEDNKPVVEAIRPLLDHARRLLDDAAQRRAEADVMNPTMYGGGDLVLGGEEPGSYRELLFYTEGSRDFTSSHFDDNGRGLLAHARVSTHKDEDGAPVLFIEEIQSDLHQKGRERGYKKPESAEDRKTLRDAERWLAEGDNAYDIRGREGHWSPVTFRGEWGPEFATQKEAVDSVRGKDNYKLGIEELTPGHLERAGNKALSTRLATRQTNLNGFGDLIRAERAVKASEDALRSLDPGDPAVFTAENLVKMKAELDDARDALVKAREEMNAERSRPPDAPMKTSWEEFVAKRVLMLAAEQGITKVGWTTGGQQMDRYDSIGTALNEIRWDPTAKTLVAIGRTGRQVMNERDVTPEHMDEVLGENLARRLREAPSQRNPLGPDSAHVLRGDDLFIGGEGMTNAYDVRIPSIMRKLVKKGGGEVTKEKLLDQGQYGRGAGSTVWTVTLPPALIDVMREQGMPLFQPDEPTTPGDSAGAAPAPKPGEAATPKAPSSSSVPKGYYMPTVTQGRVLFNIFRNAKSDASTVFHESAHAFLDILRSVAQRADAPTRARQKWADTLEWFGVTEEEWDAMEDTAEGRARQDALHEKWAEAFEVYLQEGKAPSLELERVFTRFKLWITNVFRTLLRQRAPINPAIRSVFDRLLATEDEMRAHLGERGQPLYDNAKDAGLSEEAFAEMVDAAEEEADFATRKARLYALREQLREHESWWKAEERRFTKEAEARYDEMPAEKARVILEGNDDLQVPPTILDRKQTEEVVGKKAAKKLRTAWIGKSIDAAALEAAFPGGGAALVKALVELPPREEWVKKEAEAAMKAAHPGVLEDRTKLRELVADGLHSVVEKRIIDEWRSLRAKGPQPGMGAPVAPVEVLKRAAEMMAERRAVSSLNAARVLAAERKAAGEKARAGVRGEHEKALAAAQRELLNAYLYQEVRKARTEAEELEARAAKMGQKKAQARLGKASPVYRDAVSFLLEVLGEKPSNGTLDASIIGKAVAQMNGDGVVIGDPPWLEDLAKVLRSEPGHATGDRMSPLNLGRLTVKGMRTVSDALKAIEAAAIARTTVMVEGKRIDKEQAVREGVLAIEEHKDRRPPPSTKGTETISESLRSKLNEWDGFLRNPIDLVRELVGDDQENILWKVIVNPMRRAKFREAELMRDTVKPIIDAMEKLPKAMKRTLADPINGAELFPGHTDVFSAPRSRWELLMMALNAGNESNLQRLLDGRNITLEQVTNALNLLTKEEISWVQTVLDAADSLRPEAFDLEERTTGLRPEAIKARPLELANGRLRGGYWPAVYERVSQAGEKQLGGLASLSEPGYVRPGTPHSHLKQRADKVSAVISLAPSAIYNHLASVTHDIAFREVLQSVGSFVMDKNIDAALKQRLGEGKARQFLRWLQDVGAAEVPAANPMTRAIQFVKANLAPAVLGWRASTALGDFANLPAALASTALKTRHLAVGMTAALSKEARAEALSKSKELRLMEDTVRHQFSGAIKDFTERGLLSRGPLRWYKDHAFIFMETVSKLTSTPIWLGAYRQALEEGKDDAAAVRWADDLLTQVYPSHSPVEQAGILRDKGFAGLSTVFYGYLSVAYRSQARILSRLTSSDFSDLSTSKKAGTVLGVGAQLMAFYVAYQVLGELFMGRGPEDGDDDEQDKANKLLRWRNWFGRKLLTAPLMTMPVMGDFATQLEARVLKKQQSARTGVLTSYVLSLGKSLIDLFAGDTEAVKRMEAALRIVSSSFGIPAAPAATLKYLFEAGLGDRPVPNAGHAVSGVVYGEKDKQPDTIPRVLGDLVQ